MSAPQGLIHFPGVQQIISGRYVLSHGITPSRAVIEIAPQANILAAVGTLTLTFGSVRLQFPGSLLDTLTLRFQGAHQWTLDILDRRWRWRFGEVWGRYNARNPDGSLIRELERTPQQLAVMLLRAMGESGFDISPLPNVGRPEVNWTGNNPAQELATLCEGLGCRIVLGLNNRVMIRRTGFGRPLPSQHAMTGGLGVDPPNKPDSIKIVSGPARFQSKLKLQAVGLDTDEKIKPIDDLSYKPADGWEKEHPDFFTSVEENTSDPEKSPRRLALRTVFRWYRVESQADGSMRVPSYRGPVAFVWQILPISDDLVDKEPNVLENSQFSGTVRRAKKGKIEGEFYDGERKFATTDAGTLYEGSFSVDGERGIVQFGNAMYRIDDDSGETLPAKLFLTCSYSVKHIASRQELRMTYEQRLPGRSNGTGPQIVHHPELVATAIARYGRGSSGTRVDRVETNEAEWRREVIHALQAAMLEYSTGPTNDVEYAGLLPIEPDGAIQQVSWSVGPGGAKTRASRNAEHHTAIEPYQERRQREEIIKIIQAEKAAAKSSGGAGGAA